jgi:CxxC motif-containing protein (DUF1111 family)
MEFLEEYRCPINYHPGKANVVTDTLSRKVKIARLRVQEVQPMQELLEQRNKVQEGRICVSNLKLAPDLRQEIGEVQKNDEDFQVGKSKMLGKEDSNFKEIKDGTLYFRDRLCVPSTRDLRKQILDEARKSRYAIHPREVKMYQDLKKVY